MQLILQLLLILTIISTFSICAIKPDLHKNVIVYDSDYTLVPEQEVRTETKNIPVMEMPSQPVQKTTAVEKKYEPVTHTTKKQITTVQTNKTPQQKAVTTVTQSAKVKKQTNTMQNKTTTVPKTQTATRVNTSQVVKPAVTETKKVEVPKTEQKTVAKPVEQVKVLTQQEETIAWNIWRSNLQNKIMRDTKLPIMPAGIVFKFSFTVDQYGKVSNVQTWSETPSYTPYAIQYIAPVIRSYQGREILNFPKGTQRTSTNVTGGWRISANEKFSTPHDYNDIEKVVR